MTDRPEPADQPPETAPPVTPPPVEIGGREGLDPVRYGDWEKNGIAVDF